VAANTQSSEVPAEPMWLSDREQAAWRGLLDLHDRVMARLHQELRRESDLSGPDYSVLVGLSEAPGQLLRARELGALLHWEKSRLSKQITRMEERRLVQRQVCPTDARGSFVVLTDVGRNAIELAAPLHLRHVRECFIDVLTTEQLGQLAEISATVVAQLGCDGAAAAATCDD